MGCAGSEPPVGRTGAEGAPVELALPEDVEDPGPRQEAPVAQVRPFWQQPPPRLRAQENQPVLQTYDDVEVGVGVGVGVVEVVVAVVGVTMTSVDRVDEVEGST